MIEDIATDAASRMSKSVEALKHELAKVRTGRAHPSLLETVMVPYYGTDTPLPQTANIAVEDSRTLAVTPWEKSMVPVIEKAIRASDLGLNPSTSGEIIRIPLPPLTEDRRRELVRVVRHEAEHTRVAIRNVRRDANAELKEALKEKLINEDDERRGEERIQKLTDEYVNKVEMLLKEKEQDLMAV